MPSKTSEFIDDASESQLNLGEIGSDFTKKNIAFATYIHELGIVYALYGALDGLSLSYSTIKYCFDIFLTNSNLSASDAMHDWMVTPTGIAAVIAEATVLIIFSSLANYYIEVGKSNSGEDVNYKQSLSLAWPYLRDILKGTKNTYKGIRGGLQMVQGLSGHSLNTLLLPTALILGAITILNRLWYRQMVTRRKNMMKINESLLNKIRASQHLTADEYRDFISQMQVQSSLEQMIGFGSAAYSGFIDSLYLYVGVLCLAALSTPAFTILSIFCIIYSVLGVMTRIYEEYDFQNLLKVTQAQIELEVATREHALRIQEIVTTFIDARANVGSPRLLEDHDLLKQEVIDKIDLLMAKHQKLQDFKILSNLAAFLAGAKNGLVAYGVVASLIFAVSTILFLTSTAIPPALLIIGVSLGLVCLIGFISHSLFCHQQHRQQQLEKNKREHPYQYLMQFVEELKELPNTNLGKIEEIHNPKRTILVTPQQTKEAIIAGLIVTDLPTFYIQEWSEVFRSFFSALSKASKSIDFSFNSFQEADANGHYHDTPIMFWAMAGSAILYAIGLTLRAYARGFRNKNISSVQQEIFPADEINNNNISSCIIDDDTPSLPSVDTSDEEDDEEDKIIPPPPRRIEGTSQSASALHAPSFTLLTSSFFSPNSRCPSSPPRRTEVASKSTSALPAASFTYSPNYFCSPPILTHRRPSSPPRFDITGNSHKVLAAPDDMCIPAF